MMKRFLVPKTRYHRVFTTKSIKPPRYKSDKMYPPIEVEIQSAVEYQEHTDDFNTTVTIDLNKTKFTLNLAPIIRNRVE